MSAIRNDLLKIILRFVIIQLTLVYYSLLIREISYNERIIKNYRNFTVLSYKLQVFIILLN